VFLGATAGALEDGGAADELTSRLEDVEIDANKVIQVRERCKELKWPLLEEYDFRNDHSNPALPIELRPETKIRDYQQRALARMFGNHRARSGIIVLPCGAGKTLVGIVAACTVQRSCLCLVTSTVSVEQFYNQFLMWAKIPKENIIRFTASQKEDLPPNNGACVLISTYNMISFSQKRSAAAEKIMADIGKREWGLLLMDEVHVVPAQVFSTCTEKAKSRCKLGLTATLVREDTKIDNLNFLIGPKLCVT
jgi:DNA excision repair protein ERCC-3